MISPSKRRYLRHNGDLEKHDVRREIILSYVSPFTLLPLHGARTHTCTLNKALPLKSYSRATEIGGFRNHNAHNPWYHYREQQAAEMISWTSSSSFGDGMATGSHERGCFNDSPASSPGESLKLGDLRLSRHNVTRVLVTKLKARAVLKPVKMQERP